MLNDAPLNIRSVVNTTTDEPGLLFVTTDNFGKTKVSDRKAIKRRAANGKGRPKRALASSKPRTGSWLGHNGDVDTQIMLTEVIYPSPSMFPGLSAVTMTKVYTGRLAFWMPNI